MEIKNCPTCGARCRASVPGLPGFAEDTDTYALTVHYQPIEPPELTELRADNARLSAALRRVNETLTAIIGDVHGIVGQLIDARDRR